MFENFLLPHVIALLLYAVEPLLVQGLVDRGQSYALLQLLRLRIESALVPEIVCHGIFRVAHLKNRNSLALQLVVGFQMRLGHRGPLHVNVLSHFLLPQVSDARVTQFHLRLQHQGFWRVKCNHLLVSAILHRADRLESSPLSLPLQLAYRVGEVDDVVPPLNLERALNLPALNLIYGALSLFACGALKLRQLLQ